MATAQSQFLRIFDAAGATYERWQSYYGSGPVSWDGASWYYIPFSADGFSSGASDDSAGVSVTAPATPVAVDAFQAALRDGRLVELLIYQFDPDDDNETPQVGQTLIAGYVGQALSASSTLTAITLQLGSALSPVGAQMPPRVLTTLLMGQGCRL